MDGVSVGLPNWFLSEIETLTDSFELVVRAHPMSVRRHNEQRVKTAILEAFGEQVTLDLAQERDVVEAMLEVEATFTRFSATSLEGHLLNVPNIFINDHSDPVSPMELGTTVYSMSELHCVLERVLRDTGKKTAGLKWL